MTEFMAALPQWRDHGVLGFTVNFQGGGGRYIPEVYDTYINSGFTPEGEIVPAYADRISRVLARADELGMAVIVGMFYWKQTLKMHGEPAVARGGERAELSQGHRPQERHDRVGQRERYSLRHGYLRP